jgi:beta-lactamase class A
MLFTELESCLAQFKTQNIALAFHDLETGQAYSLHADESFHAASTFKVAVMMEAYHRAGQGLLSLDDRMPVINSFPSLADGRPFSVSAEDDSDRTLYERIGGTETMREIMRLMIVRSSNLAANLLIQKLEARKVAGFLTELGIAGVHILRGPEDGRAHALGLNNSATARGLMLMMKAIVDGQGVSRAASDEMTQVLLGQEFNEGIPAGLPQSVRVAHKTGWNDRLYHDVGIVRPEGRQPYVLAVMTSGFEIETQAHACVAQISHLIYEQISY